MKIFRILVLFVCFVLPQFVRADETEQVERLAAEYAECTGAEDRLQLANKFFAYLQEIEYIDEPIAFPADSHIDSVDVNVYYYVSEWFYGEGDYQRAIDYGLRAGQACTEKVDAVSKSDVYALLGAVYFRKGEFDKAVEALSQSYETDKAIGDMDRMSSTLNSIASVFVAAGKPQDAEKYIQEAIAANSLTENLTRRAVLYGTASELYRSLDETDRSLDYARKALDTERMVGDSARIGVRLSQLASAQLSSSKIEEARRSLEEAIPLLLRSGNLHSWGICQNQMGDILASEDKNDEAAACYLDAAMLFLKQGDKYNELHAREGLYKTMKDESPRDAMMHLERAKLLQDSIYQQETGEALGKYNAIYYNDILQKEKERTERRNRIVLLSVIFAAIVFIALIAAAASVTYRRHRKKIKVYEHNINSMQQMYDQLRLKYQDVEAYTMQESVKLTADDKKFLSQLASVIYALSERGVTDIDSIASQLHISFATLRRRLALSLATTPSAYIQRMRMQKAKDLLQGYRDMPITEVAEKCGYTQVQNFTRAFTRFYGTTPSDERKN